MTDLGNNDHELVVDMDQYYGFPPSTNVALLAFVFRNVDGSLAGKTATGEDIFYPIYPINGGFEAKIFKPYQDVLVSLNDTLVIKAQCNSPASISFYDNNNFVFNTKVLCFF